MSQDTPYEFLTRLYNRAKDLSTSIQLAKEILAETEQRILQLRIDAPVTPREAVEILRKAAVQRVSDGKSVTFVDLQTSTVTSAKLPYKDGLWEIFCSCPNRQYETKVSQENLLRRISEAHCFPDPT